MKWVRPLIRRLKAYVPGEQLRVKGLIKLNTNENPYPPAPEVLQAVRDAVDERLRLYPNPTSQTLREKLARFHGCKAEQIIIGNGSDDILAMAIKAFVEPEGNLSVKGSSNDPRCRVQMFEPSYSLYPVLTAIHGARLVKIPLQSDFCLPAIEKLSQNHRHDFDAALTFITSPNAPSGKGYSTRQLKTYCQQAGGMVLLDEAYADFADDNALNLALEHSNVLVTRTFSKAYSLCFQRIGYAVGHPDLILALDKIRDSYNVNGLAQIAAETTLDHLDYYRECFDRIIKTREETADKLKKLGFKVFPSQTNFLLVQPPVIEANDWFDELRSRKILVRWFDKPKLRKYLRISIGTPSEMNHLLKTIKKILKQALS